MYQFERAAITKYHRLGGLKRNVLSSNSGCWKSKLKVLVALVPSEGYEGKSCSRPLCLVLGDRLHVHMVFSLNAYLCPDLPLL